jgi:hypothetical protein
MILRISPAFVPQGGTSRRQGIWIAELKSKMIEQKKEKMIYGSFPE